MIARRTPATTILVLAGALAGCELVAGIEDRPLGDGGTDVASTAGTTGAAGAGAAAGRGGAGGSAAGTAGASGGAGGAAGTGGATGAAGAGGATGAGGTSGAAGRGGSGGAAGAIGTAGTSGGAGSGDAAGTTGGTGGGAGTSGSAGAAGTIGGVGGAGGRGGAMGGSGGGGRGGAAGSSGGSAAGSGGSLPFTCPAVAASQVGIADFETGPAINSQLISTTTYFPFSTGVEVSFNAIVSGTGSLARVSDAHGGAAALNFGVTGSGTRQGTLYMRFNLATGTPPGAKAACVDASRFSGIRFWAKGPASVELSAYTPQPTSEVGVVNHSASKSFGVNNQWQLIEIRWDELQPSMIQFPFDPSGLWFVSFVVNGLQDQTLTLDDVAFIP